MDGKLLQAVRDTTLDIFQTMISMDPQPEEPISGDKSPLNGGISGIVGIAGKTRGTISIHFDKNLAIKIASNILEEEINEINDDVEDAVGEIANMVAGGAKTKLFRSDISFDISIPTVIAGEDFVMESKMDGEGTLLPFTVGREKFFVEISLQR